MDKSQVYFTTFKATLNENLLQKLTQTHEDCRI